ncbi:hypothetical protein ACFSCX_20300 [Bacillus salitolerans]|uniref:Lipoprotein n=1 Tax=Bacillus salitolerans TaxID=1437434 RepID=A0ABW4LUM3_9BACI
MNKSIILLFVLMFLAGCVSFGIEEEESFVFSYTRNSIVDENKERVNNWLNNVKKEVKIHSLGTINGYEYFYARGFNDVLVTYLLEKKQENQFSLLRANFKKGNEDDEILIEVKYNPSLCCDGTVIDDSYTGKGLIQ